MAIQLYTSSSFKILALMETMGVAIILHTIGDNKKVILVNKLRNEKKYQRKHTAKH